MRFQSTSHDDVVLDVGRYLVEVDEITGRHLGHTAQDALDGSKMPRSVSDVADPAGIPVLDGLGPVGDGMHTREEYVELASFERRIRVLAELLAADGAAAR